MKLSDAEHASLLFAELGSTPATPAAGKWRSYFKSTGLYYVDDAGVETGPIGAAGYAPGGTDVAVADGGTGASTAAGARTNLGLVIGTDVLGMGGGTLTGDLVVPDEAYDATGWNGSLEVPTKNAVRDKIESLGSSSVSDTAYGSGWNGDTTTAPSKNAVYDKIETLGVAAAPVSSTVLTSESTNSTSYVGLTTAHTATIDVPASGKIIVCLTVDISANSTTTSRVSFALSGANTLASADDNSIRSELSTNFVQTETAMIPLSGLTPGSTVVTVQCKCSGGNTVTLSKRRLTLIPG